MAMPKDGFKTISIHDHVYEALGKIAAEENRTRHEQLAYMISIWKRGN